MHILKLIKRCLISEKTEHKCSGLQLAPHQNICGEFDSVRGEL